MRQAFSLVEVMVSLVVGTLILTALMMFSMSTVSHHRRARSQQTAQVSLAMVRDELVAARRGLEPEFWHGFPRALAPVHPVDHDHGAVQWTQACPQSDVACLILWDLLPVDEDPVILKIVGGGSGMLRVAPLDPSFPPGPDEALGPMSVLLFYGGGEPFCALVKEVWEDEVFLVPPSKQPWESPEVMEPALVEIVHLGRLVVRHLTLGPSPGRQGQLTWQPWTFKQGNWRARARSSSWAHLVDLKWRICDGDQPDRLLVATMGPKAPFIEPPIVVGDLIYDREVCLASIPF